MTENRLDRFNVEELQSMLKGANSSFTGWSEKSVIEANEILSIFCGELDIEITKRRKVLEEEIERTTTRCECCNQRIEK